LNKIDIEINGYEKMGRQGKYREGGKHGKFVIINNIRGERPSFGEE